MINPLPEECTPIHTIVGPACAFVAEAIAAGIKPACAALPLCIINPPPMVHKPTPHNVIAPAIAFLLICFSSFRF